MPNNEFDNERYFELSQDTLRNLLFGLSNVLIRRGRIESNPGVFQLSGEGEPRVFSYPINSELIKELFYADDDEIRVRRAEAKYTTPYALDENERGSESGHSAWITVDAYYPVVGQHESKWVNETFSIGIMNRFGQDRIDSVVDTEYSKKDGRISPNGFDYSTNMGEDENLRRVVEDYDAATHSLDIEEAEQVQGVIEYIEASAPLTD